MYIIKYIITI